MIDARYQYFEDLNALWLKYHKEPLLWRCSPVCRRETAISASHEEREKFYLEQEQKLYGQQVPYCLSQKMRSNLQKEKEELQKDIEREKEYLQRRIERGPASPMTITELDGSITTITREEQAKKHAEWITEEQEKIDKLTAELAVVQQALDSIPQMAEKLGLDLSSPLDPLRDPVANWKATVKGLPFVGIMEFLIVVGGIIFLLKRRKNKPEK